MKRPKIGISMYGHMGYDAAIQRAGGETVVIRPNTPLKVIDNLAGIVIPGGQDVCPIWYGEKVDKKTQNPNQERDALELAITKRAIAKDIPFLGVCRGHQVLNVALGGTLIQHIDGHILKDHLATMSADSKLLDVEKFPSLNVNSLHHQAVGKVGDGLIVVAVAMDGTVEAIERPENRFVLGVQWHPEMHANKDFDNAMSALWRRFVHAAA